MTIGIASAVEFMKYAVLDYHKKRQATVVNFGVTLEDIEKSREITMTDVNHQMDLFLRECISKILKAPIEILMEALDTTDDVVGVISKSYLAKILSINKINSMRNFRSDMTRIGMNGIRQQCFDTYLERCFPYDLMYLIESNLELIWLCYFIIDIPMVYRSLILKFLGCQLQTTNEKPCLYREK